MKIERDIVKTDIPLIEKTLLKVFGSEMYLSLERLGGNTNHTYYLVLPDKKEIIVRLPGDGTESVINRKNEYVSTKLACDLGIDVPLLFFSDDGTKVMEYIPNAVTMDEVSMHEERHIVQAAEIFRKLHSSQVDTGVPFEVFDMAAVYERFIHENNVSMPSDYQEVKNQVVSIKSEVDSTGFVQKVPCHNDPLCENWVEGNGTLYLVDWEYAGMNDPMWDIAAASIEACFGQREDQLVLQAYLGHDPVLSEKKHLVASKIFVDYLWTLWAKMRVPFDGQPMEDWASERYSRMLGFINVYHNI